MHDKMRRELRKFLRSFIRIFFLDFCPLCKCCPLRLFLAPPFVYPLCPLGHLLSIFTFLVSFAPSSSIFTSLLYFISTVFQSSPSVVLLPFVPFPHQNIIVDYTCPTSRIWDKARLWEFFGHCNTFQNQNSWTVIKMLAILIFMFLSFFFLNRLRNLQAMYVREIFQIIAGGRNSWSRLFEFLPHHRFSYFLNVDDILLEKKFWSRERII